MAYYRHVETGQNGYFHCVSNCRYRHPTYPNEYAEFRFTGAFDSSGYYTSDLLSPSSNFETKAIIKARLKLKGQKVNLPQMYAERGQVVRLIHGNCRAIAKMIENVRRLKPGRYFRQELLRGTEFFDRWLELQYGWKPLLSDCYGAVAAFRDNLENNGPPECTVKALVREELTDYREMTENIDALYFLVEKEMKLEHKGFIRLDFTQDMGPLGSLSQLGITNPLELAWELLPWSFVADWFVPIGDFLSSLDATLGWSFKGGSWSVKTTEHSKPRLIRTYLQEPYYSDGTPYVTVTGSGRKMLFTRTSYASAPLPTLPDFSKFFKGSDSPTHLTNGIALIMSALAGKVGVR